MPNFKFKIDVTKLDKSVFFHGKNGAVYCDLVAWENRGGADIYGNSHAIQQDFPKGKKPEKPPYMGNAKPFGFGNDAKQQPHVKTPPAQTEFSADDEIPF